MRYYRENPDEPIRHCWIEEAAGYSSLDMDKLQAQEPLQKHKLKTPAECDCDKTSSYPPCPICDWGLAVCSVCGAAESELDKPCNPPLTTTQAFNLLDIGLDTDLADGAAISTTPVEGLEEDDESN